MTPSNQMQYEEKHVHIFVGVQTHTFIFLFIYLLQTRHYVFTFPIENRKITWSFMAFRINTPVVDAKHVVKTNCMQHGQPIHCIRPLQWTASLGIA